jgi:hypothetical protein
MTEQLAPTALCTDEDVRIYLGRTVDEVDAEDRDTLIRLVNAASETFTDESQRIWRVDPADNPSTKRYVVEYGDVRRNFIRIDDATQVLGCTTADQRIEGDVFVDLPFFTAPPSMEPIIRVELYYDSGLVPGMAVDVEANWGWPVVPEKVRQAVIYTAAEWFARDVEKFSATFSVDVGRILLPSVLPQQVWEMAMSYRRWRVA